MTLADITIGPIKLKTLPQDASWYRQRRQFEEQASALYRFIAREGFRNFIDVGANTGLISILARRAFPEMRIISIEADSRLVGIIPGNFDLNSLRHPELLHAIVSDRSSDKATFSLNPISTLDNRVTMAEWTKVPVQAVSLDDLFRDREISGKTFLKIDTQGHEKHVLAGFESTMRNRRDWLIKMEFAPKWLRSQGTDPVELARTLAASYDVSEYHERIPYNAPNLASLRKYRIDPGQSQHFVAYVDPSTVPAMAGLT